MSFLDDLRRGATTLQFEARRQLRLRQHQSAVSALEDERDRATAAVGQRAVERAALGTLEDEELSRLAEGVLRLEERVEVARTELASIRDEQPPETAASSQPGADVPDPDAARCDSCGAHLPPGAHYCTNCGAPVADPGGDEAGSRPRPDPGATRASSAPPDALAPQGDVARYVDPASGATAEPHGEQATEHAGAPSSPAAPEARDAEAPRTPGPETVETVYVPTEEADRSTSEMPVAASSGDPTGETVSRESAELRATPRGEPRSCGACGAIPPPSATFCTRCGTSLASPGAS